MRNELVKLSLDDCFKESTKFRNIINKYIYNNKEAYDFPSSFYITRFFDISEPSWSKYYTGETVLPYYVAKILHAEISKYIPWEYFECYILGKGLRAFPIQKLLNYRAIVNTSENTCAKYKVDGESKLKPFTLEDLLNESAFNNITKSIIGDTSNNVRYLEHIIELSGVTRDSLYKALNRDRLMSYKIAINLHRVTKDYIPWEYYEVLMIDAKVLNRMKEMEVNLQEAKNLRLDRKYRREINLL